MNQRKNPDNHLHDTTSPYLQQHADNPVNWHPWNDEALSLAKETNKPILLSIGYSACHWCHVMAHESFEDDATAELMNELYINIKVDREERPDLDKIYQTAHQLLAQRPGGWPLTVFLTPDEHIPFFAGTYFPETPRHGLPEFKEILTNISDAYQSQKEAIQTQNQALLEAFTNLDPTDEHTGQALNSVPIAVAYQQLSDNFDDVHGGFGGAPKFPHPSNLEFLLHRCAKNAVPIERPTDDSLKMLDFTLRNMARGGIQDHLGGGFCRYSVDEFWLIPHFEKMLYDNALLLPIYSEAWRIAKNSEYKETADNIARWIMRDMQSPSGGYYSSIDADSEGEEGRFYIWTKDEIEALLEPASYQLFAAAYGLEKRANFEGNWNLFKNKSPIELSDEFDLTTKEIKQSLAHSRDILLATRNQRIHPGRDEKILTSWNALMMKGMAQASRAFDQPEYLASAEKAFADIKSRLWKNNQLLAVAREDQAHLNAYLDDYAYLIDAILELLQCRWRQEDYDFAIQLADILLDQFEDKEGGFFFTANNHEALIHRPKPFSDDAIPAGNAIAAKVLGRLGHITGDSRYLIAAENTLRATWSSLCRSASAYGSLLSALEEHLQPPEIIILRGPEEELQAWKNKANTFMPSRVCLSLSGTEKALPTALDRPVPEQGVAAYICSGMQCSAPITDIAAFL